MNRTAFKAGFVGLYLSAIVLANMISAHWGAEASIYNAFFMIGLVLTTRDRLDDLWGGRRFRNMALLILSGSALSFAMAHAFPGTAPPDVVARIALASCVAFFVAESMDFAAYRVLHRRPWLERSNTSNLVGAALDSMIFVSIAFGWNTAIIFGQFAAKVAGGFVWSLIIRAHRARQEAAA